MFCEQCGAAMKDGSKFCESCGAPVDPAKIVPVPAEASSVPAPSTGTTAPAVNPVASVPAAPVPTATEVYQNGQVSPTVVPGADAVYKSYVSRIQACGVLWLCIGILQVIIGLITLLLGVGIFTLGLGVWNIIQASKDLKTAAFFSQNPAGITQYANTRGGALEIVMLVLNVIFGALVGIAGSVLDLVTSSYGKQHLAELNEVEIRGTIR